MCKNDVRTNQALPETEGTFLVIRGISAEDLHVKGQYGTAVEAKELEDELKANGYETAVVFIPNTPVGPSGHSNGRHVAEVPLGTFKVVLLTDE